MILLLSIASLEKSLFYYVLLSELVICRHFSLFLNLRI